MANFSRIHPQVRPYLDKYPWLLNYDDNPHPGDFGVELMDAKLLTGRGGSGRYVAVDKDGNKIAAVGEEWYPKDWGWWTRLVKDPMCYLSVMGMLSGLEQRGKLADVAFIVHRDGNGRTIVRRPPGKLSIIGWMSELEAKAQAELESKEAAIDAGGSSAAVATVADNAAPPAGSGTSERIRRNNHPG